MPTPDDLLGAGTPPLVATMLGNAPRTTTCAGTTQATATAILTHLNTLSAASSQTGAILPSTGKIGTPYFFYTSSSTGAVVYVPVGDVMINATAATSATNGSFTLAQYKSGIAWKASTSTTISTWVSLASA